MTTILLFVVLGVLIAVLLLLTAWLLLLGARWAKISDISFRRALLGAVLINVPGIFVHGFGVVTQDFFPRYSRWAPLVELVLALFLTWGVLCWILRTSLGKAIVAWLLTWLAGGFALILLTFFIRPYLFEPFAVPTNSMAPAILGHHMRSTCPSCGAVAYIPAISADAMRFEPRTEDLGICGNCLRAATMPIASPSEFPGDRIVAAKFLRPGRWDVIVFRFPEDPSINFVKRLVGLPGEEVAIEDGDVWINGERMPKPEHLAGLVYAADPMSPEKKTWGPVKLGGDEYLALGDFSLRARDSRLWETGAPGHPPYAVPASYILGVVTHTYWPPSRWRTFR